MYLHNDLVNFQKIYLYNCISLSSERTREIHFDKNMRLSGCWTRFTYAVLGFLPQTIYNRDLPSFPRAYLHGNTLRFTSRKTSSI